MRKSAWGKDLFLHLHCKAWQWGIKELWNVYRRVENVLTWEVNGKSRFADVEVRLKLDGDHIQGAVDAVG